MADISRGPDLYVRVLNKIEDGSARTLPGEAAPNAHEKASSDLVALHAALRQAARLSGRPAKGKLVITLEVVAGVGNGDASPCEHFFSSVPTFPKLPKLSRPSWLDDEGNILGSEPRQMELGLHAVNKTAEQTPKASKKVV